MKMNVLDVAGDWYHIGRDHGKQKKQIIQQTARQGLTLLAQQWNTGKSQAEARLEIFLPFFQIAAPHLLDEIRGIAEGADITFSEAFYLNVRHDLKALAAGSGHTTIGCTSFAAGREITRDRSALAGQNKDTTLATRDVMFLIRIRPKNGPALLGLTYPGEVGPIGINGAGLGAFSNTLYTHTWALGCPHNLTRRLLLEQSDITSCEVQLRKLASYSPGNFTIADADGNVACLELVGQRMGKIGGDGGLVVHANHVLHSDLKSEEVYPDKTQQSEGRQNRLKILLKRKTGQLTHVDAQTALQDHACAPQSICRHGSEINGVPLHTSFSLVGDLKNHVLHLAKGHPCQNVFEQYTL